ncbi:sulfotransferase family protein [Marinirhabdus gelatinilytica]|uniref:Sulfotransferase family protein n=1 Tax=Marinirhabdus gelatinilytica TaxID=1703343 RepID=A0A370QGV9_9FLAO|nr:sulfotransferase [Marinirhabdus gelatinilytica]RDK87330.1 sulfotransferase family protein [Marinirhabdus gelatinilytica]
MKQPNKANLFLVGAMKAGTTTLMDFLSQHPKVYASPIKEPHYFVEAPPKVLYDPSRFFSLEKYLENEFPASLHIANVKERSQYEMLFSLAREERYLLEGSTQYLHAPGTAEKIHSYNPEATILIIRRDPLKRAFSHYSMLTGLSKELRTFEEVMKEEIQLYENGTLPWYSCLAMSFYQKPIAMYRRYFDKVLVVDFEALVRNSPETVKLVFDSLDLEHIDLEPVKNPNTGRNIKYKRVFYFLKGIGVKDIFSKVFPTRFKHWLFKTMTTKKAKEIPISKQTELKLNNIFNKES